jgi:hypothetical protein
MIIHPPPLSKAKETTRLHHDVVQIKPLKRADLFGFFRGLFGICSGKGVVSGSNPEENPNKTRLKPLKQVISTVLKEEFQYIRKKKE